MIYANHSSQSGQDVYQLEALNPATKRQGAIVEGTQLTYLPTTSDPDDNGFTRIVDGVDEEQRGLYPLVELTDPAVLDSYMTPSGDPVLAVSGPEYTPGTTVTRTQTYVTQTAEQLRSRKYQEGESYANTVGFSSAQTEQNANIWVLTREIDLFFYNIASGFYGDRHKDRTLGTDSTDPGSTLDPTTYWAQDVPVFLVNSNNGNFLQIDAQEDEWGQVLKEIGTHVFDTRFALDAYRDDVDAKYNAYVADPSDINRDALINLDPTDPTYGWPPWYDPFV